MLAGIETGGTKIVCAVSADESPSEIAKEIEFPIQTPTETLRTINEFFDDAKTEPYSALGFASFGPVNVDPRAERYGFMGATPKPGWSDFDLLSALDLAQQVPLTLATDVSGAAIGEQAFGAGAGFDSLAYITCGTGVGVGIIQGGALIQGNGFPEMGHIRVKRHPDDAFEGTCPFHGDCVEGMAAGPAVKARLGASLSEVSDSARVATNEFVAFYLGQLIATLTLTLGTKKVVLGGGVLKSRGLLARVRSSFVEIKGDYGPAVAEPYIVEPQLGGRAGVIGALELGRRAIGAQVLAH